MISGNWIEKDGKRIALPATISIQTNSPLTDKTYVFYAGNKISKRGDNTYPFTVTLSEQDLAALGSPHIIQRLAPGSRLTGWSLYSDGTLVDTFTILFTSISRDLNGSGATVEMLLSNPVSDFVDAISTRKVNDLVMNGVRVIDDTTNYLTDPTLYGAPPAILPSVGTSRKVGITLVKPDMVSTNQSTFQIKVDGGYGISGSPTDLLGTNTADYAAIITLNGDPEEMICFPTVQIQDESAGDSWLNFWDAQLGNGYYPCVGYNLDESTPVDIFANFVYNDYGNHIVPMYYYHQVIRHCFSEFGYELLDPSGILSDPHFKKMVLVNNYDILNAITLTYSNQDGARKRCVGYWQLQTIIDPHNHLPDDSIQDFLNDVMLKFNCYFEFDGQYAYIRFSDFDTASRELKDYNPKYKEQQTIDTGLIISYDFPADKQYDNVKNVSKFTKYHSRETVFDGGFNKVYPVSVRDLVPEPLPQDAYYAVLYEDCNQLSFVIKDTPIYTGIGSTWVYPYHLYLDNVLPLSIGTEVRPDSESVNSVGIATAKGSSYSLKYPPISQINNKAQSWVKQVTYNMSGWGIESICTDDIPKVSFTSSLTSMTHWLNMTISKGLVIPPGSTVSIHARLTDPETGVFLAKGTVYSYNNETGALVVTLSYVSGPDLSADDSDYFHTNGGSPFGWNDFLVTIEPYEFMPSISVPIMAAAVIAYPTQDYTIVPELAYAYTYDLYRHTWAFKNFIAGSSDWILEISSGRCMPDGWINRQDKPIFEMGFYWGLQQTYADTVSDLTTGTYPTIVYLGQQHSYTAALTIPVLTGYERIYGNTAIAPGWFNLSLHGRLSLPSIFWKGFINQFIYNRKFTITVYEPVSVTRRHLFNQSVIWRGIRLYVSEQNADIPYQGKGVTYVCYQI